MSGLRVSEPPWSNLLCELRGVLCVLSVLLGVLAAAATGMIDPTAAAQTPSPQEPPRFRSSVEVTSLDATVVDDRGRPITDLAPQDFRVQIDGKARTVVSAEWVPLVSRDAPPPPPPPDGYSTNENSTGGRLIVLAVDEPNIRVGGALAVTKAATEFVDRLAPSDRVAVAGIGPGAPATPFTADRQRLKQAIGRLMGRKAPTRNVDLGHNIGISEALQIDRGDSALLAMVQDRECQGLIQGARIACEAEVQIEARTAAQDVTHDGDETLMALRALFSGLRSVEGAKTSSSRIRT
jgi:VWFA-related protein